LKYSLFNEIVDARNTELLPFPNPTTGKIYLYQGSEEIEIIDLLDSFGKQAKSMNYNKNIIGLIEIDLGDSPPGTYFLRLLIRNEVRVTKILKF